MISSTSSSFTSSTTSWTKRLANFKYNMLSLGENKVEKLVRELFRRHGRLVGTYPIWFLVVPLLLCGALSTGMHKIKEKTLDVTHLYTPTNAPSNYESRVAEEYFEDENGMFVMKLVIFAKDGGSLLRSKEYIEDVVNLITYIEKNFTVNRDNSLYTFTDIRQNHVLDNEILLNFLKLYKTMHLSVDPNHRTKFNFGFPVMELSSDTKFSLAGSLAGVTLNNDSQIDAVKRVYVRFRSAWGNGTHSDMIHAWEMKFLNPDSVYRSPTLDFLAVSDRLMSMEMQRNGQEIQKFSVLSFCVLTIFAVITSTTRNCITSKPWEAFCGIISTMLSVGTSFGIILYAGYPFLPLLLVAPVLVLALGLDVTFIVLRSWQTTNSELPIPDRLAETMAESGPSIVITSLTNIISAAVGAMTNTMAVHMFCLTVTVSVMILFLLQITFFAATIALGARRENAKKHAFFIFTKVKQTTKGGGCCNKVESTPEKVKPDIAFSSTTTLEKLDDFLPPKVNVILQQQQQQQQQQSNKQPLNRTLSAHVEKKDWWYHMSKKLAKFECTLKCRISVTILMLIYWGMSIWGCVNLTLGLTMEKLFLPDSLMTKYFKMDNGGLHDALKLYLFVSNPPNFSLPRERQRFYNLVNDLESLPYSWGSNSTELWIKPYNEFKEFGIELSDENNGTVNFYSDLPYFIKSATGKEWLPFMFVTTNPTFVRKFIFSTTYHPAKSWGQRADYTDQWRQIVNKYPEFNVSIWDDDNENYITDQLESIPQNTIQDVVVTGVCMAIICILFIPNIFNTLCAMITIFSINVGVFGFLVHWDVSLDPISMASLLMAIGFSVDFTSHISFHYYTSEGRNQYEKLASALASIGFPMIQSGTATVLSIACVCLVKSYMVWIFFKTVFLVVAFGLFHGLIILPTYLAWLPLNIFNCSSNSNSNSNSHSNKNTCTVLEVSAANAKGNKPDIVCNLNNNNEIVERL